MTFVIAENKTPEVQTTRFNCTQAEAIELITKFRGGYVWLSINGELPIVGSEGMVFPAYTTMRITKRVAKAMVHSLLGDVLESRGGRIKMKIHDWPDGNRGLYVND